ncbi:MAG: hypothetical protein GMKNLPBB_00282 [Myxococcota bacterium]|nr:hypothetical protein [Myxococcota bacterium]
MNLRERLTHLDRRWLFLLMGLALLAPLLMPLKLPFAQDRMVQDIYDGIEKIPPGSTVLVSSDFDPASAPELYPFSVALYQHLFQRDIKVVVMSLWPAAPPLVTKAIDEVKKGVGGKPGFANKQYGTDYINLGFRPGEILVIKSVSDDIRSVYSADTQGGRLDSYPIMNGVNGMKDFAAMINVSAGYPGIKEWVQQVQSRYGVRMACATTAVAALDYIPYYKSGQLFGLSAGMKGSADYEKILGVDGKAISGLDTQNIGHLLIIFAIVLGNAVYFLGRRKP